MRERDERDVEEAHRLIDWCQDHTFWRSVIRSMENFRRHYDQMRLQAIADRSIRERRRDRKDALAGWIEWLQRRLPERDAGELAEFVRSYARKHGSAPSVETVVADAGA